MHACNAVQCMRCGSSVQCKACKLIKVPPWSANISLWPRRALYCRWNSSYSCNTIFDFTFYRCRHVTSFWLPSSARHLLVIRSICIQPWFWHDFRFVRLYFVNVHTKWSCRLLRCNITLTGPTICVTRNGPLNLRRHLSWRPAYFLGL